MDGRELAKQRVHAATQGIRRPDALRTLIEAWREVPDPALAELIEVLSQHIGPPELAGTGKELKAAWWAELGRNGITEPVLNTLHRGNISEVVQRVEALVERDPDPRLVGLLLAWLHAPPFTSKGSQKIWRRLFNHAEAMGDPRLAWAEDVDAVALFGNATGDWMQTRIQSAVQRAPAPPPPLPLDDLRAAIEGLLARAETTWQQERALLEAIYADPTDAAARLVLADLLVARGDPRGELIQLQCLPRRSPEQTRRVNAILRRHRDTLLGSLEGAVQKGGLKFSRGFLSSCTLDSHFLTRPNDPAWATVERVELRAHGLAEAIAAPPFTGLRHIGPLAGLEGLVAVNSARLPVTSVDIRWQTLPWQAFHDPAVIDPIGTELPPTRTLDLRSVSAGLGLLHVLPWFDEYLGGRVLDALTIRGSMGHLPRTTPVVAAREVDRLAELASFSRVEIWNGPREQILVYDQTAEGIDLQVSPVRVYDVAPLEGALEQFPSDRVRRVELDLRHLPAGAGLGLRQTTMARFRRARRDVKR